MASATEPSQECVPRQLKAWSPYDYDSTTLADIILRSSDFTDFYVFKPFLRFVSPFFQNMFASPPGTDASEKMNGFTVIPVEETSETLRLLLDFIYPYESEPDIDNVPLFLSVCKATQKYSMNIIENRLRKQIIASHLMDTEPLRLYAAAVYFGWEDAALIAAQKASQIPLDKLSCVQELKNISGSDFYRFLEYKMRRDSLSPRSLAMISKKGSSAAGFGAPAPVPIPAQVQPALMKLPRSSARSTPTFGAQIRIAQKPFDTTAKADIVLRSKDFIDFFILADLVRAASAPPSLSNITIPLGKTIGETEDGRAIISVPEDSEVLRHLLGLVYHISDEICMQTSRLYTQVVLAARRRGMSIIEARLRKQLTTSPLLHKEPLRVYIIASALCWDELAKSAALNTLSEPLDNMTYMQEFDLITGTDLYRLVAFRFKCAVAACDVITGDSDYKAYGPGKWHWDSSSSSTFQHYGPTDKLFEKLRSCPRGSTIADAYKNEAESKPGKNGSSFARRDQLEPGLSTTADAYEYEVVEARPVEKWSSFAHRDQRELGSINSTIAVAYKNEAEPWSGWSMGKGKREKRASAGSSRSDEPQNWVTDSLKSNDDYTVRGTSLMKILECRQEIEDAVEAAVTKVALAF